MEKGRIAFIINPKSGRKSKENIESKILEYLDLDLFNPAFYFTMYPRHASKLVYQLAGEGYTIVVAVGGDGTVNEVAGAVS